MLISSIFLACNQRASITSKHLFECQFLLGLHDAEMASIGAKMCGELVNQICVISHDSGGGTHLARMLPNNNTFPLEVN
jgi:hypothetical protein